MKPLEKKNISDILALTPMQEGMLFHYLTEPHSQHYVEQLSLEIEGPLDKNRFEHAWQWVTKQNAALRTMFRWEKIEKPMQIILKEHITKPLYVDLSSLDRATQEKELQTLKNKDCSHSFDLHEVPFRLTLCKLAENHFLLLISNYHILYDGWSTGIILKEFFSTYHGDTKPTSKTPFKEYIKWLQTLNQEEQNNYWRTYLQGLDSHSRLPLIYKRNERTPELSTPILSQWPSHLQEQLETFVKTHKITLATILYSAWGLLLNIYNDSQDIVFGTTVAGRSAKIKGIEDMVGLFINTLPLRINYAKNQNILNLLLKVDQDLLNREAFETVPLVSIRSLCEAINGQEELFDTLVVLENYPLSLNPQPDDIIKPGQYWMKEMTHYPLTLTITHFEHLEVSFNYTPEHLTRETVIRLSQHFQNIVTAILNRPLSLIHWLDILSPAEKEELLVHFNTGAVSGKPQYRHTLHQWFIAQAERYPERPALLGTDTYRQVAEKSLHVAHYLLNQGVQTEDIVAIKIQRSVEMIVGIFGILLAGAAYLPLDPDYPTDRTQYLLSDSHAKLLLTKQLIEEIIYPITPIIPVTPIIPSNSQALAYIIYTSGSTGKPKGVLVEHCSAVNILEALQQHYPIQENDTFLFKTSFLFDVSVAELFGWFVGGGGLAILSPGGEKDANQILKAIGEYQVTHINFVPSMFRVFMDVLAQQPQEVLSSLKYIFLAGEALPPETVSAFRQVHPTLRLENLYGPTESTVYASYFPVSQWSGQGSIPIGKPLAGLHLFVLDSLQRVLPLEVPGELYIAGMGVARGYLNNPLLTAEKFISNPALSTSSLLYRTGDLTRWLPDGNLQYLGRLDRQVKIRGFRIELGEIENCLLTHPEIKEAVVLQEKSKSEEPHLCAYLVYTNATVHPEVTAIKEYLSKLLPPYMVPAFFFSVEFIPLTATGKIDRRALAAIQLTSKKTATYIAPRSHIEQTIAKTWQELLHIPQVGLHDNFFDLGGNSLLIIRLASRLSLVLNKDIPVVTLFNFPTINALVHHLYAEKPQPTPIIKRTENSGEIAIIGMAGRFPGASNISIFWENLKNGIESISFFYTEQPQELDFVPAKGVMPERDYFDAAFFGYTPVEARIMDPQVRIFHHCIWETLENGGYDPFSYPGTIGLYAGATPNPFWEVLPLRTSAGTTDYPGLWNAIQFSDKDYLSTRIAYKLNLKGPCLTLQTACSTSLTAVDQACRALLSGACDMALAGGVSLTFHDDKGYLYQEGTIMSPDGHCRAFDSQARGTVGGNGAGAVLLKRLPEALADHDFIYAVIKGIGISNDGKNKVGFTAPSVEGEAAAIRAALAMADMTPQSIGYIETHGTGTPLGDPIEIQGLKTAFACSSSPQQVKTCALGSVKTNIGHLDAAAGITGLIKTVLVLFHRLIPPTLHFQQANPALQLENSPFYVNTQLSSFLSQGSPLRAGVSSFGLGGTNVHIILEEAPPFAEPAVGFSRPVQLLQLSATTSKLLPLMAQNLAAYLQHPVPENIHLADVAYSLQVGRRSMLHRRTLVCSDTGEAIRRLIAGEWDSGTARTEKSSLIFMFSGQGSQYVNMGLDLYQQEPLFQQTINHCFTLLEQITGLNMKPILYPSAEQVELAEERIYQFLYTTPIKFIFEYALAQLLISWGIKPDAMIGHSFGEYVAACLAGVFSLEDGLYLAALRGQLMHTLPAGAMLSVSLSEEEITPLLPPGLSLAAMNTPSISVVSGPIDEIESFETTMTLQGHECIRFRVPKAGHSWMVEPILTEFKEKISGKTFHAPQIPYVSGKTGHWITAAEATDPHYWVDHIRQPVRFLQGLTTLLREPNPIFLQVGPGKGLTMFISQHPDKTANMPTLNMLRHPKEPTTDMAYLLTQVGQLWRLGIEIDWHRFYAGQVRQRLPLPHYPFNASFFPVDPHLLQLTGWHSQPTNPADETETIPGSEEEHATSLSTLLPRPHLDTPYQAPTNPIQEKITTIWQELLGYQGPGIEDNFFTLNGDSLKAVITLANIHKQCGVKISLPQFFSQPTIKGLAEYITAAKVEQFTHIEPIEKKDYYPLSSAQKRIFFLQQLDKSGTTYNIPSQFQLLGQLDKDQLETTTALLIARHESFRTYFEVINEEPCQRIKEQVLFKLEYYDYSQQSQDMVSLADFVRPFDLSIAPLLRLGLIKCAPEQHILVVDMHHIISDGMSIEIMAREFFALFTNNQLPTITLHYKDYAAWHNRYKESQNIRTQQHYWQEQFTGELPVLELPVDFGRPPIQSFAGCEQHFLLDSQSTTALKELALSSGSTLYMVLLTLYTILLAKLSNREDLVIGTPVAGRRHADLEHIIGMFVNTLVLRYFPAGQKSFSDFLSEVKEKTLKGFENQDYQYEDLVERLIESRDPSRNPLFDTLFTLRNTGTQAFTIPGLTITPLSQESISAKFDLSLTAVELNQELDFTFEYCVDLFQGETIKRFITYFKNIISAVLDNNKITIADIQIISAAEKQRILLEFNATATVYPADQSIHQLFSAQAGLTPDFIAIVESTPSLISQVSYSFLHEESTTLARTLLHKGVLPHDIVAISGERSIATMIGILAILKVGAAYLPIDPDYPEERKQYMLTDSNAKTILYQPTNVDDEAIPKIGFTAPVHNNYLAYVIYTSGTTGKPKGVMVSHKNVVRLVKNTNYIDFNPQDTILQTGAMVFDASTFEIWGALLNGASLVLVPKETLLTPEKLKYALQQFKIRTMWMTSPLFNQMVQGDIALFAPLKHLLVGGDVLSPPHIARVLRVFPLLKIINGYGPTENTTFSTTFLIQQHYTENIPIGKPIANSTAYVIDAYDNILPTGIPGQLIVGGDGIAWGYLNNPEMTHTKFCTLPGFASHTSTSCIFYKTGDLTRWLPDGNLEFLGRIDNQVKIRGFRIELSEIEHQLLKHGQITETIVLVKTDNDGDKYLVAYYVAETTIPESQLIDFLLFNLPDYMIPSHFVQINKMPLTATGKVDWRILPEPRIDASSRYIPPRNERERKLAEIWHSILNKDPQHYPIGIEDNFFQLGGHSLKATALISRMHKVFKVKIPLAEIFKKPTISSLAHFISNQQSKHYSHIQAVEEKEYYELSSAQKRMFFLQQLDRDGTFYNIYNAWTMEGEIDKNLLEQSLLTLIQRHESFRTTFEIYNDLPIQRIHRGLTFEIEYQDLSWRTQNRESVHTSLQRAFDRFVRPFELSRAPLFRVGLVKYAPAQHLFMVDMHHIISDGLSTQILLSEFSQLLIGQYLLPSAIRYRDYTAWQRSEKKSKHLLEQEKFWLDCCVTPLPVLDLPTDFVRPAIQGFAGHNISFTWGPEITMALKSHALSSGTTLFILLLSLYNAFLAKICHQDDIMVGTPVAGRNHADLEYIIGMFVNTVVLRNFPTPEKNFSHFLDEVTSRTLKAFENQEYQYEDLVEKVAAPRETSRNPLFDTMFTLQDLGAQTVTIPGLVLTPFPQENKTAKFDLSLVAVETTESLQLSFEYNVRLFTPDTIQRFATYFTHAVVNILAHVEQPLSAVSLISDVEKRQIVEDFNRTKTDYPAEKLLHDLFYEQVQRTPDHIALTGLSTTFAAAQTPIQITYAHLLNKARQLARYLSALGVATGDIVALKTERSLEMMIGILGVLQAGAAYLPLSSQYPADRLHYMISDSNARIVLTGKNITDFCSTPAIEVTPSVTLTTVDNSCAGHLAYVIYTSGTTGKPKGVMVEHNQVVNNVCWYAHQYELQPYVNLVLLADYTFDASVAQIFGASLFGATLFLLTKEYLSDMDALRSYINKHRINHIDFVPILLYELLGNKEKLASITTVISGGEKLEDKVKDELRQLGYHLHNDYGPTETTVNSLSLECSQLPVSLGKPIANTQVYILDKWYQLLPVGIAGELYIAGAGVARGYLNNPEMTHSKFSPIPHSSFLPSKLYKTGDYGKWQADGTIFFLGRIDQQIKLRGFRIELGEIESHISMIPEVQEVVVLPIDKTQNLCAYYLAPRPLPLTQFRNYLEKKLPGYMMPAHFIWLERFPVTVNGKLDINALKSYQTTTKVVVVPQTTVFRGEIERFVADTWKQVLHLDNVDPHDNFFDLGGNSLSILQVNTRLKQHLKRDIPVVDMFQYPTVRQLASYLGEVSDSETTTTPSLLSPLPLFASAPLAPEVAVIGMACSFPGAPHIRQFWENLLNGTESITFFTAQQLAEQGVEPLLLDNPLYVKAASFIEEADRFDAAFFGYTPIEARVMDPQIRLFHEIVYACLEDAGYIPGVYAGAIGLYAGASSSSYWEGLALLSGLGSPLGDFAAANFTNKDFLCSRISYNLDLKGPSSSVQTACSTGLVAIHQAYHALMNQECQMAIAGAVSLFPGTPRGYLYQEGMIQSRDGHCRAFDASASGTIGGNGAGAVLLKPLNQAILDDDHIYAIIKGSAINNDGHRKVGYTAPSIDGQVEVIRKAHQNAGIEATSISYIETHGTGTHLGDPVECAALKTAFNTRLTQFCALGSVKTNFGHLDTAAGVAGFIKTVLSLYYKTIPASLHFNQPNPRIDLINSPFYVQARTTPWPGSAQPRRAGVSAFGIGGTNAHIILEETQPLTEPENHGEKRYPILLLSAQDSTALTRLAHELAVFLANTPAIDLTDVAYTQQIGRTAFPYKQIILGSDIPDTILQLTQPTPENTFQVNTPNKKPALIFTFNDSTALPFSIVQEAYRHEPLFRQEMDGCLAILEPLLPLPLKPLFAATNVVSTHTEKPENPERYMQQPELALPLLVALQYAIARLLMSWKIYPTAMMAKGVGFLTAAHLAGLFSLPEILTLAVQRGRLLADRTSSLPAFPNPTRPVPTIPLISPSTHTWLTAEEIANPAYWHAQLSDTTAGLPYLALGEAMENPLFIELSTNLNESGYAGAHDQVHPCIKLWPKINEKISYQQHLAHQMGRLWLYGVTPDWQVFHGTTKPRRISLPTYPFGGDIYRLPVHPVTSLANMVNTVSSTQPTIKESFSRAVEKSTRRPRTVLSTPYQAPTTPLEEKIAHIWEEMLGWEHIGVLDDFFELGGSSLSALQFLTILKETEDVQVTAHVLLQETTIYDLARAITGHTGEPPAPASLVVQIQAGSTKKDQPTFFLVHPIGGHVYVYRDLALHLGSAVPVYGIQARGLDGVSQPLSNIQEIAALYIQELQTVQPVGPYYLGGASLGGMIAFEMAQQLHVAGQEIALLFMIDTPGPQQMGAGFQDEAVLLADIINGALAGATISAEQIRTFSPTQLEQWVAEHNRFSDAKKTNVLMAEIGMMLALFKASGQAMIHYQPQVFPGRMVYFRALELIPGGPQELEKAWLPLAAQGVTVYDVSGNHNTMNETPHVAVIANVLKRECHM